MSESSGRSPTMGEIFTEIADACRHNDVMRNFTPGGPIEKACKETHTPCSYLNCPIMKMIMDGLRGRRDDA